MSMIGYVRQITNAELAAFRANPKSVRGLLREETLRSFTPAARAILERMDETPWWRFLERRKLSEQLSKIMRTPGAYTRMLADDERGLRLDKYWHDLHYLLTGKDGDAAPPLGNAVRGGTPIGDDLGYGPARFLTPEQVREVAAALQEVSKDELTIRPGFEEFLEDTLYYFDKLVEYYKEAAERGNAMLLYIR